MALKDRVKKLENISDPEEIKITANVWDEDKEPWPATPEQKRACEATRRPGVKTIWIESNRSKEENRNERI